MLSLKNIILLCVTVTVVSYTSSSDCSYPYNYSGIEVWGLINSSTGASSQEACAAACCADANCGGWQYCAGDSPPSPDGCGSLKSCWIGPWSGDKRSVAGWISFSNLPTPNATFIDASTLPIPASPIPGIMSSTSPSGHVLSIDTNSMQLDGVRILPFAGEMHPSRVPRQSWAADLAKIKAGGLSVVQAYIFWLHVEPVQGIQDWSDNRNVTAFLDLAQEAGLLVSLRIGPWCHGEARSGGIPDWSQQVPGVKVRTNTTLWMSLVRGWYSSLSAQLQGRYWSTGGPIISIQVDNESGDVDYLLALRGLAVELGMNPWYWVKTGWPTPNAPVSPGNLFPVSGGYFDEFWTTTENSTGGFLYGSYSGNHSYPTLTVEVGPGMASSYHRRIHINPIDAGAAVQVFLASGVSELGMYMYHGGTDPIVGGTTAQEQQDFGEGGANDMPCRTYDFHAPLGEAGQPRDHYNYIRRLAFAASTCASWLAETNSFLPEITPTSYSDTSTLRWSVRGNGKQALAFLNTVQTFATMQPQTNLKLSIKMENGTVNIPASINSPTLTLPVNVFPIWAIRTLLPGGVALEYATASPLGDFSESDGSVVSFWSSADGVQAEFAIIAASVLSFTCQAPATCSQEGSLIFIRNLDQETTTPQVTLVSITNVHLSILLLDDTTSLHFWRSTLAGVDSALLSDGATDFLLSTPSGGLSVVSRGLNSPSIVKIFPQPNSVTLESGGPSLVPTQDGIFSVYSIPLPSSMVSATFSLVSPAGPARVIPAGRRGVAEAPARNGSLAEFTTAAVYNISLIGTPAQGVDVRLQVNYTGDVARLYPSNSQHLMTDLIMDHFWNFHDLEAPLTRFGISLPLSLELRILPQGPRNIGAFVYFEVPPLQGALINEIKVIETATVNLVVT
jgi:beta-galactosidase